MIGEISYVVGATACGVAGISGVIVMCNEFSEQRQRVPSVPLKKWLRKHIIKALFIGLFFSISYDMCILFYTRHFHFCDQNFQELMIFELRTMPVTICVVGLAWQMVVRVARWLLGIDKDLKW